MTWKPITHPHQLRVGTLIRSKSVTGTTRIKSIVRGPLYDLYYEEVVEPGSIFPTVGTYAESYARDPELLFCNPLCPKEAL